VPGSRADGIQLPVLDGYAVRRQIKALPGFAAIPNIAVSSFAMEGDEEKARASGCNDYVTKPYSLVVLLQPRTPLFGRNSTALMSGLWVRFRVEM
jgi:CheY-like chemotaxis protein